MFEPNHIPDDAYRELVDLMGREEAEEYLKSVQYDYRSVMLMILKMRLLQVWHAHKDWILIILGVLLVCFYWNDFIGFLGGGRN